MSSSASTLKRGLLFQKVEAAIHGDRKVKWEHIVQYLDAHTYTEHSRHSSSKKKDTNNLPFESALPSFCHATDELQQELAPCRHTGDSILRRAVLGRAPHRVVATLCHLGPHALQIVDPKGRLLLHLATRLPVNTSSVEILQLLVVAHPLALLARDAHGRTPLHWLLWYHCAVRSPDVVAAFLQPLPKAKFYSLQPLMDTLVHDAHYRLPPIPRPQHKIPHHAGIIPDAVFGCWPLHYAAANGASEAVVALLLQSFPQAKHMADRYGRTPAHWYLGAGHTQVYFQLSQDLDAEHEDEDDENNDDNDHDENDETNTTHHNHPTTPRSTAAVRSSTTTKQPPKILHISGETNNPHAPPWYRADLSSAVLQTILSSRVARTTDAIGRNPLHWACYWMAHKVYYAPPATAAPPAAAAASATNLHINSSAPLSSPMEGPSIMSPRRSTTVTTAETHWPEHNPMRIAQPILQTLLDAHAGQILIQDTIQQTPLLFLFQTLGTLQLADDRQGWPLFDKERGGFYQNKLHPNSQTASHRVLLEIYPPVLRMLLEHPDGQDYRPSNHNKNNKNSNQQPSILFPAAMEDEMGRLPLHVAAQIALGPQTLATLVEAHPTGLVHTTEAFQTPLHVALGQSITTPYYTALSIKLFLETYSAGFEEVSVDGRMALKLEDANGIYPVHYACENDASCDVVEGLIAAYPAVAFQTRHDTHDLPVFHLVTGHFLDCLMAPNPSPAQQQVVRDELPMIRRKVQFFLPPLCTTEAMTQRKCLHSTESQHKMVLLHVAILTQAAAVPYYSYYITLWRMLQHYPESALHVATMDKSPPTHGLTNQNNGPRSPVAPREWTCLDAHEAILPYWLGHDREWHMIRQMLFAYNPTADSHRHRHELLQQCVAVVVQEVNAATPPDEADNNNNKEDETAEEKGCNSSEHYCLTKEFQKLFNTESHGEVEALPSPLTISHSLSLAESTTVQRLHIRQPPAKSMRKKKKSRDTSPSHKKRGKGKKGRNSLLSAVRERLPNLQSYNSQPSDEQTDGNEDAESNAAAGQPSVIDNILSSSSRYDEDDTRFEYDGQSQFDDDSFSSSDGYSDAEGGPMGGGGGFGEDDDGYTEGSEGGAERVFSDDSSENSSRRYYESTFDEDETDPGTWSPRRTYTSSFSNDEQSLPDAFDRVKDEEGLSDGAANDEEGLLDSKTPKATNRHRRIRRDESTASSTATPGSPRPPPHPGFMSQVGMRLWTFFSLYCDLHNPGDNYVSQVASIFAEIPFHKVEMLIQLLLPSYASEYLLLHDVPSGTKQTFRDVASPKCRELIQKTCYFVGMYEFANHKEDFRVTTTKTVSAVGASVMLSPNLHEDALLVGSWGKGRHMLFTVRAVEWIFTTQEATDAAKTPGISEEQIWNSGEVPAEMGVTFRSQRKPVHMTFLADRELYENELLCREALAPSEDKIALLLNHFKGSADAERRVDKAYKTDIQDIRFRKIAVGRGRVVDLRDFQFCLVHESLVSLQEISNVYGDLEPLQEIKSICTEAVVALKEFHEKGVVHGNLSRRNVVRCLSSDEQRAQWCIANMTSSCLMASNVHLGRISSRGKPLFCTGTLPPEMFLGLTAVELRAYERYWNFIARKSESACEKAAVEPMVDLESGETFVVRCHSTLQVSGQDGMSPQLPYTTIRASPATDFWALGLLVYELCAGRPLFAIDPRTGNLLDYRLHARWTPKVAAALIYETVGDPVVQDLLLLLLSPVSKRSTLSVNKILSHPFFTQGNNSVSQTVQNMMETRRRDFAAHKRVLFRKLHERSEQAWLNEHTKALHSWDFDVLTRFQSSPAALVQRISNCSASQVLSFPTSILVLPFSLSANREGRLVPSDSTMAITVGTKLIQLSKACTFGVAFQKFIETSPRKISISELLSRVAVQPASFAQEVEICSSFASQFVESVREDPRFLAHKLIHRRLDELIELYSDADLYVYLVDEYQCSPLEGKCWRVKPNEERRDEFLQRSILGMHMTCLYGRKLDSQGLLGMVKLLHEATFHMKVIPTPWSREAQGLDVVPEDVQVRRELMVLQKAMGSKYQGRFTMGEENLNYIRDFLSARDPQRRMGDVIRVVVGNTHCLWTSSLQADAMVDAAPSFSLEDCIKTYGGKKKRG